MNKVKVSVIVPVYNGERYIKDCIEQIQHQTLKEIEVIIVDDGSTDSTNQICNSLAGTYDNCLIIHQKNEGVSSARNHGIECASGEYVVFFDVDDQYDNDLLECLYNCISSLGLDYLTMASTAPKGECVVYDDKITAMSDFLLGRISFSACYGIYRKSLYPSFSFPVGRQIYEDFYALYKAIEASSRIGKININKYHYIKREGSNSRANVFAKKYFDAIELVDMVYDSVKKNYSIIEKDAKTKKNRTYLRIVKIYYLRKAPLEHIERIRELKKYLFALSAKEIIRDYGIFDIIRLLTLKRCFPLFAFFIKTIDKN